MKACGSRGEAQGGGPPWIPSEQAIQTAAGQSQNLGGAAKWTWPALLRLLDSKNPGYAV